MLQTRVSKESRDGHEATQQQELQAVEIEIVVTAGISSELDQV